jgi:hypothetical protein
MPVPSKVAPSGSMSTQRENQTATPVPASSYGCGLPLAPRVGSPTVVTCGRHRIICTKPSPLETAPGPIRHTTGFRYGSSARSSQRG